MAVKSSKSSKSSKTPRLVDKAAKAAHETIERLHERVGSTEKGPANRTSGSGGDVMATFERRAQALGNYIEANPVKAAVIAFGIGAWASRIIKVMEPMLPEKTRLIKGTETDKAQDAGAGDAS